MRGIAERGNEIKCAGLIGLIVENQPLKDAIVKRQRAEGF
jgi:hypothetical protein